VFLALFALVNRHERCVGEDVLIDPDLEFHMFHENHLLSWSEKSIEFTQRDKTFEKFE